jgi:signal transduction histidine kinase
VLGLAGLWLAMAVLFALAFWLSFRVVIRPMRALAKRVADRDAEDLSPIEESAAFTEVRPLLTALNQKLATIRSLLDSERQFFADAAHELRTPLSVIGAQAHVLAHEPGLPDRLTALREIEGGIDRSARAVGKLLTLARLQHRHTAVDAIPATHDLTELAASAVAMLQARAAVAKQSLQFEGSRPAPIRCDSVQVTTLLENLIDNALRYSPAGSRVHVSVETPEGRAVIVVTDNGPGIAPEDRTRVFDRFQRLGRADAGGSGLGLAIVQRIAALHDARVQLGVGPDGRGLSVEIHFPQL